MRWGDLYLFDIKLAGFLLQSLLSASWHHQQILLHIPYLGIVIFINFRRFRFVLDLEAEIMLVQRGLCDKVFSELEGGFHLIRILGLEYWVGLVVK